MSGAAAKRPQIRLSWIQEFAANLQLAIPIAIGFLAQMAMIFIDNVMVGRLGSDYLAAGGLGANLYFTPIVLGMGVLGGIGAVTAHFHGAGDEAKVAISGRQGLRLAVVLTLPLYGVLIAIILLLPQLGYDPSTVRMARGLLLWGLIGVPAATLLADQGALYIGHSERIGGQAEKQLCSDGITTYRPRQAVHHEAHS